MYTDEMIRFIIDLNTNFTREELSNQAIADSFEKKFGIKKSENAIRKVYRRYKFDSRFDSEDDSNDVLIKNLKANHTARKNNSKLRKENKSILDSMLVFEDFLEELKVIEASSPVKMHKPIKVQKKGKTKRTVVAHMADNHIGAIIRESSMGGINEYNPEVAARRIAFYVQDVSRYKMHHRDDTDLVLILNGDMLHGVIHGTDTLNCLPAALQHCVALRIFAQAISFLGQHYKNVKVVCESGNHGRFMHKMNKGRQTEEKWDSFETILYVSLQEKFREYKNVDFIITETPYTIMDIQGHKALITHGDTVVNTGNPGKSINVDNITKQINSISAGLGYKIDMVIVGHVHKATYVVLDNGTHLVINGPLSGTDEYAQSLGIISSNPIQQIFEVTPKDVIGDMRFVRVNAGDKDKSLDKIITVDSFFTKG